MMWFSGPAWFLNGSHCFCSILLGPFVSHESLCSCLVCGIREKLMLWNSFPERLLEMARNLSVWATFSVGSSGDSLLS